MIGRSLNLRKPFNFWVDLASYQRLIISKEQAGIERALGSTYFARGINCLRRYFNLKTYSQIHLLVCFQPNE
ncbi:hypothetical protein DPMN_127170 [Dreissena polymorpha]|uniref:Uncharacterized protein n=1 Tax=Dreissena polymorpha TaxID=45954 RepID=A0A9D4GYQ2_DREPO|nr:hypothetical protein DPMN_127170 [Dreissena polymorpha]